MKTLLPSVALALVVLCSSPAIGSSALVIMPFDNISGADSAPETMMGHLTRAVGRRGWRVVEADTAAFLEKERIRYLDSLDSTSRQKLLEAAGAVAVLSGTIFTWSDGSNPTVAVAARLMDIDGELLWANVIATTADEAESLFGIGRKSTATDLAGEAVGELMRGFPSGADRGRARSPVRRPRKPLFLRRPPSFRAPELEAASPRLVCVLPFENRSANTQAARIVHDAFTIRLAADPRFDVVDPAALRAAALQAQIGSFRGITNEHLIRLGAAVGTSLFVRGTIFGYAADAAETPRLDIDMTLVDVESGRVLWAVQHERKGSDYSGLFLRGTVTSGVALADRVVGEMIGADERDASPAAREQLRTRSVIRIGERKP